MGNFERLKTLLVRRSKMSMHQAEERGGHQGVLTDELTVENQGGRESSPLPQWIGKVASPERSPPGLS